MTRQPGDTDPGRRPPDYVIVVAASDLAQGPVPGRPGDGAGGEGINLHLGRVCESRIGLDGRQREDG